jgi:hemolysin D
VGVGDAVEAGTVLATLDPTFTESERVAERERLASMQAEERRLEAEIYGRRFPPLAEDSSLDPKYMKLQAAVYARRQGEFAAYVAGYEADAARFEASLVTSRNAQAGLEERLKVIGEVETMREDLLKLSAGSRLNLLQSQLDRLTLQDQLAEKRNQETELFQQLKSAREQRERYVNNWIRQAGERLTELQQNISTATQKLASAERRRNLVVLRSPADGIVLELGQRSIGSVAKQAEALVTLVPRGNKTELEVDVDSSDVARLRVGDPVRVKLDALPFQSHGTLSGVLRIVTENSFQPDKNSSAAAQTSDGQPSFFRARISLGPLDLHDAPEGFRLIPGMTGAAEINIGRRSIISYVLDPVVRLFDEGLREP